MNIFICLDDNNGMLFNGRRQSRDEAVIKDMLGFAGDEKVWVNSYSSNLFHENPERIMIKDNFPKEMCKDGYCFLEDIPLNLYGDSIDTIIAYGWNRVYPADVYLDIDLINDWEVIGTKEFGGKSHGKITRKIYKRKI